MLLNNNIKRKKTQFFYKFNHRKLIHERPPSNFLISVLGKAVVLKPDCFSNAMDLTQSLFTKTDEFILIALAAAYSVSGVIIFL